MVKDDPDVSLSSPPSGETFDGRQLTFLVLLTHVELSKSLLFVDVRTTTGGGYRESLVHTKHL